MRPPITSAVILAYLWVMLILFGSLVLETLALHRLRLLLSAAGAVLIFTGFLRYYREQVLGVPALRQRGAGHG